MSIFATVVDKGSFRAAASYLNLSPSWVSEAVSKLEKDIGVTLIYRSTRSLSLTIEGGLLYEEAKVMIDAAERGLDAIKPTSKEPRGLLRVTFPSFVTQTPLMDTLQNFMRAYPKIKLNIDFTDSPRSLIKEGFDVGIRVGYPEDSELRSRKISEAGRLLIASASYAKGKEKPAHPSDLEEWDWIRFTYRGNQTELTSKDGEEIKVTERHAITVNSADAVYQLALRGFGITPLPENLARKGIANGDFVHLLPDWYIAPLGVYAVWPGKAQRENMTRMFVQFLVDASKGLSAPPQQIL